MSRATAIGVEQAAITGSGFQTAAAAAGGSRMVAQLGKVVNAFNQVDVAARLASNRMSNLAGQITGNFVKAFATFASVVKDAAAPIEALVRIHNPAVADTFMRAIQDAFGVVGRELVPVMNAF